MSKLYLWKNDITDSDFYDGKNARFGYHSGAIVVLAGSVEEARKLADDEYNTTEEPIVIDTDNTGVVVNAGGEC